MSACMSGTRGSGVLSSTGDVLVRGVGGVCDMCMCLASPLSSVVSYSQEVLWLFMKSSINMCDHFYGQAL